MLRSLTISWSMSGRVVSCLLFTAPQGVPSRHSEYSSAVRAWATDRPSDSTERVEAGPRADGGPPRARGWIPAFAGRTMDGGGKPQSLPPRRRGITTAERQFFKEDLMDIIRESPVAQSAIKVLRKGWSKALSRGAENCWPCAFSRRKPAGWPTRLRPLTMCSTQAVTSGRPEAFRRLLEADE